MQLPLLLLFGTEIFMELNRIDKEQNCENNNLRFQVEKFGEPVMFKYEMFRV